MIINIIGECDKRPVTYCILKILQSMGDVLYITSNSRLRRLSDTGESGGHYQNTMIGITLEGVDDFFQQFNYSRNDFYYIVVDNVVEVEADLIIHIESHNTSDNEAYMLSLLDSYKTIRLYRDKLIEPATMYKLDQFESLRDMTPMTPKVVKAVSKILSESLGMPAERLMNLGLRSSNGAPNKGRRITDGKVGKKK